MNKLLLLLYIFIIPSIALSEDEQILTDKSILALAEKMHDEPLDSFIDKMKELSQLSVRYAQKKNDECLGEFSSVVINDMGEKVVKKRRLSRKEKKLCLYLLINFRIKFTKIVYIARKNHLKQMHQQQVDNLIALEKKRLKELQQLAHKYK
ncbi:MAG: hypothetical protein HON90_07710 [Halobacteriovoraceae bacterium]|nr:hypothetical protein [Halobacteriovoraceae bacterium]